MALTSSESVLIATADGDGFAGKISLAGVKVVGGASGATVKLRANNSSSGAIFYEITVGNTAEKFDPVELRSASGVYVNITAGSGTVYLYTQTDR